MRKRREKKKKKKKSRREVLERMENLKVTSLNSTNTPEIGCGLGKEKVTLGSGKTTCEMKKSKNRRKEKRGTFTNSGN